MLIKSNLRSLPDDWIGGKFIHRDLHMSNVLVNDDSVAVIDFGDSKTTLLNASVRDEPISLGRAYDGMLAQPPPRSHRPPAPGVPPSPQANPKYQWWQRGFWPRSHDIAMLLLHMRDYVYRLHYIVLSLSNDPLQRGNALYLWRYIETYCLRYVEVALKYWDSSNEQWNAQLEFKGKKMSPDQRKRHQHYMANLLEFRKLLYEFPATNNRIIDGMFSDNAVSTAMAELQGEVLQGEMQDNGGEGADEWVQKKFRYNAAQ
jgi:hypothetical protein